MLDLAVLGVASERARTTSDVVAAVKQVGAGRFQPVTDVILGRLGALAEAGLLSAARTGSGGEAVWRLSLAGRAYMERLLLLPSGPPVDALAAACACLKICFLELLQPDAREAVIEDLLAAHRHALDEAQAALTRCAWRCPLLQRFLARDVERWEAEVGWLDGLAREFETTRCVGQ
jgi:DNA-binding PadR family transcriptional regulator